MSILGTKVKESFYDFFKTIYEDENGYINFDRILNENEVILLCNNFDYISINKKRTEILVLDNDKYLSSSNYKKYPLMSIFSLSQCYAIKIKKENFILEEFDADYDSDFYFDNKSKIDSWEKLITIVREQEEEKEVFALPYEEIRD